MIDERLREKERLFRSSGSLASVLSFGRELLRVGRIDDARGVFGGLIDSGRVTPEVERGYVASGGLWLRETDTDFVYYNVPLSGKPTDIAIRKHPLDNGERHSFYSWLTYLDEKPERLPTAPELMSILLATYNLREVEALREAVSSARRLLRMDDCDYSVRRDHNCHIQTSTSVSYVLSLPTDFIYTDRTNPQEQPVQALVRGSSTHLDENHADIAEILLGSRDIPLISQAGNWLADSRHPQSILSRHNPPPSGEHLVGLGLLRIIGNEIFDIDCIENRDRYALGVVKS